MALDTEEECHFQVVCKENTETRSFIEMVEYLEFPTEMYQHIGRIVSDREAQKAASTYFDIRHSARSERLQQCRLLMMTGGSFANDRCSTFPTLDTWLSKLVLTIFDKAQQFGEDREVTTIAMLPPTCLVVWMGNAQQTPGGIAKEQDQFAISRKQLMMRKHGLQCPQKDVTPHSLSTMLCALLQEVDDPSATALAEVLASANSNLGPLWVDHPDQDQRCHARHLGYVLPGGSTTMESPLYPRHTKTPDNIQRFSWVGAIRLRCLSSPTFVLYWIGPMNGFLIYRLRIPCPQPVWLDCMHGVSMLPTSTRTPGVCFSCTVAVRYDPLCVCSSKTPKHGASAHIHSAVSKDYSWWISIGALATTTR